VVFEDLEEAKDCGKTKSEHDSRLANICDVDLGNSDAFRADHAHVCGAVECSGLAATFEAWEPQEG